MFGKKARHSVSVSEPEYASDHSHDWIFGELAELRKSCGASEERLRNLEALHVSEAELMVKALLGGGPGRVY